jgi:acetolactate synthase I/II/III large subunit
LASRQLEDGRMVSSPLEDLAPFLSRAELAQNMLIPLVDE